MAEPYDKRLPPPKSLTQMWRRPSVSDNVTVCKICDQGLADPRVLPCMHPFCETCLLLLLEGYERHKMLDRTFPCPTCSKRTPCLFLGKVSAKWLNTFPKKVDIDNLKEAILVVDEMCKACAGQWRVVAATTFCTFCQEYMCEDCTEGHKSNPENKLHTVVQYEVKDMKKTPVSNISKFTCKPHSNLRYSGFCEIHNVFVCNTCKEGSSHRNCRVVDNIIEKVGSVIRADVKICDVNNLRRDGRGKGKTLYKTLQEIDKIQTALQTFRDQKELQYCNYVQQAIITEQKTEAIDALKGKLDFVKVHQSHDVTYRTLNKVENIITRYADMFDMEDEKPVKAEINKSLAEIHKILNRECFTSPNRHFYKAINRVECIISRYADMFDMEDEKPVKAEINKSLAEISNKLNMECFTVALNKRKPERTSVMPGEENYDNVLPAYHVCKKHAKDTLDEGSLIKLGPLMTSVGVIRHNSMLGTAFRVGSKYVMTAAHVVRDIIDPERSGQPDKQALEASSVFISFESPPRADGKRFHLTQNIAFLDDGLNVAVLEVADPESLPPPLLLSIRDVTALCISDVAVIGYGHKDSQKKFLDTACSVVTVDSPRAKQATNWLRFVLRRYRSNLLVRKRDPSGFRWNYDDMRDERRVTIDCSLEYRAYGSPAIAYPDDEGPEVMAVFSHGIPDCFSELPEKAQLDYKDFRFEVATKMSSVYEVMCTETRMLADDIFIRAKEYYSMPQPQ